MKTLGLMGVEGEEEIRRQGGRLTLRYFILSNLLSVIKLAFAHPSLPSPGAQPLLHS